MLKIHLRSLLCIALLSACGQESSNQFADDPNASDTETPSTPAPKRRSFGYKVELSQSVIKSTSLHSLSLAADATAFTISLSDCASTHTATVTEAVAYLEVYEFDRNCIVKLTEFTLNGLVYTPKSGADFTSWQTNDTATFEVSGATPANELKLEVLSTISNPVVAAGSIHFQFSEITVGATETLAEAVVRESASLSVNGQASPNFEIKQVSLVGITAIGNGEFRIQLGCKGQAVTGTGVNILCYDVLLSSISMVLAEDTYGSVLTQTNLDDIFTAASGGKQIDMTTEAFIAGGGTPAITNGGFITANTGDADVMVMAGTKPIVTKPNMIFILKSGPSYTYFNIDVTTITQNGNGP